MRMKRREIREREGRVPNKANMRLSRLNEFVRMLKYATLLHHHGPIDRIVNEYVHTRDIERFAHDLIAQTGSRDVVLESVYMASLSNGNPSGSLFQSHVSVSRVQ